MEKFFHLKVYQKRTGYLRFKNPFSKLHEYTLMLVPNKDKKVFKVQLSLKVITCSLIGFFLFSIILAGFSLSILDNLRIDLSEKYELITLREENSKLQKQQEEQSSQINELAKNVNEIKAKSEELNKLDYEVRSFLNEPGSTGVSRSAPVRISPPSSEYNSQLNGSQELNINQIKNLTQNLNTEFNYRKNSLTEIRNTLEERQTRLNATPNLWPTQGQVTSRFGSRNDTSGVGSSAHKGIDIANATGTAIIATAAGTVTYSGEMSGFGYLIIINHGYGIETYYAHNSALFVQEGEFVKKGQKISAMGNTGVSTGSHLHYEVRFNGTPVDPAKFL